MDEMETAAGGIFDRIILNHWDLQFDLSSVISVCQSQNSKYVGVLDKDGHFQVIATDGTSKAEFALTNVRRFCGWKDEIHQDGWKYSFAVETLDREIQFYKLQSEWIRICNIAENILVTLLPPILQKPGFPEIRFLGHVGLHQDHVCLTFTVEEFIIALENYNSTSWTSRLIPEDDTLSLSAATALHVKSKVYALSANLENIYGFSVQTGIPCSSWSLRRLVVTANPNYAMNFNSLTRIGIWETRRKIRLIVSDSAGNLMVSCWNEAAGEEVKNSSEIADNVSIAPSVSRDDESRMGSLEETQSVSSLRVSLTPAHAILATPKSKKIKSITGFKKDGGSASSRAPSGPCCRAIETRGTPTAFEASSESLAIIYGCNEEYKFGAFAVLDVDSLEEIAFLRFEEETLVAMGGLWALPHLLLTKRSLSAFPCLESHANLISRVMLFESGHRAESLARVNDWDTVSVPISVLNRGLKHRQVEAVAFFLKGKESLIAVNGDDTGIENALLEFDAICESLVTSIEDNMMEIGARRYGEQLLCITINFLNRLLRSSVELNLDGAIVEKISQKIMGYLGPLRKLLKNYAKRNLPDDRGDGEIGLEEVVEREPDLKDYWAKWSNMDSESDVIRDGIISNRVLTVQTFLVRNEKGRDTLRLIFECGLRYVQEALEDKDIDLAKGILVTLGLDSNEKLREILMHAADKDLREFLIVELNKDRVLSSRDSRMIEFLHRVEKCYPCPSFEKSRNLKGSSCWKSYEKFEDTETDGDFKCEIGEVGESKFENCQDGDYSHLLLNWVQCWSERDISRVMTEAAVISGSQELPNWLTAEAAWDTLLEHADTKTISAWIKSSQQEDSGDGGNDFGEITRDMVDRIGLHAPSSVRNEILNLLARCGTFATTEREDFSLLLERLNANRLLSAEDGSKTASLPCEESAFVDRVLRYCVDHRLGHILFHFLERFRIHSAHLDNLSEDFETSSWVRLITKFKDWDETPNDAEKLFMASLSCVGFSSDVVNPTVDHMLREGQALAAIASLLYVPGSISRAADAAAGSSWRMDTLRWRTSKEFVESALASYPSLKKCFAGNMAEADPSRDALHYILLQDNTQLDVTALFGWQENNTLKSEEASCELPHFSQPDLVASYGLEESPDVIYYLEQARPSFALSSFIDNEMKRNGSVSDDSVCKLANKCVSLMLKNFENTPVVAAGVILTEMVGKNSHAQRVFVHCARLVRTFLEEKSNVSDGERKVSEQLPKLFAQTLNGDEKSREILMFHLEEALKKRTEDKRHSADLDLESVFNWGILVRFCRLLQAKYPDTILQLCATKNNWILFFICAQVFCYPYHQVVNAIKQFSDCSLSEHLANAMSSPQYRSVRRRKKKTKDAKEKKAFHRDPRSVLYSRMGFVKQKQQDNVNMPEEICLEIPSLTFEKTNETSAVCGDISDDLLAVVLQCHQRECPWMHLMNGAIEFQNPLLAVLAACYEECSVIDSMCAWIDASSENFLRPKEGGGTSTDLCELRKRLEVCVEQRRIALIVQVFQIFLPESPLVHLLSSINEFVVNKSPCLSLQHLKEFTHEYKNMKKADGQKLGYTHEWLEETCDLMIHRGLQLCTENLTRTRFLEIIHEAKFSDNFVEPAWGHCTYKKLLDLHKLLENSSIIMDLSACCGEETFLKHCTDVVEQLTESKLYDVAYEFADVAGLKCDHVVLLRVRDEFKRYMKDRLQCDQQFWKKCVRIFAENHVSPQDAANFFQEACDEINDPYEKFIALRLSLAFATGSDSPGEPDKRNIKKRELEMWYAWIQAVDRNLGVGSESPMNFLDDYRCLHKFPSLSDLPTANTESSSWEISEKSLTINEIHALEQIVGKLVDEGNLRKADELCQHFGHKSPCVDTVQTCLRLATGDLHPRDCGTQPSQGPKPGVSRSTLTMSQSRTRSISVSSISSLSAALGRSLEESSDSAEILSLMETLAVQCENGTRYCARLLTFFKISLALGSNFADVISCQRDKFFVLQKLLQSESADRFLLAKDFIATDDLTDHQVAVFLCEQIVWTLRVFCGSISKDTLHLRSACDLIFRPTESASTFVQLVKLCQDPSILGFKLLQAIETFRDLTDPNAASLKVEILICAHSCFTVSCNVEGITLTLKFAKDFSQSLAKVGEFILMVRLLTGIGRYHEMMYIFDTLQENDQFELLFRKGMEKVPDLKTALIDYLRRSFPEDTETFTMVALRFSMYREIAELLESAAKKSMTTLAEKILEEGNVGEVSESLERTMQFMADAYESFLKADCIQHALTCAKQAELLALQIHLLPNRQIVVGLNPAKITEFIVSHDFNEAVIVAEAYDQHHDWAHALYAHFVVNSDKVYLRDFLANFELSSSIFDEVVKRFKNDGSKSDKLENMKKLLEHVEDVKMKYVVASDLGLVDTVTEMISGDSGPFLNDSEVIQCNLPLFAPQLK